MRMQSSGSRPSVPTGHRPRSEERLGDRAGAARTWDQLAQMIESSGRPEEAEGWYRKALGARREVADPGSLAITLNNLANLLRRLPGRLDEARALAEESLALSKTLDPAAAEIWKTYSILGDIAEAQGDRDSAADYRRQERSTYAAFPGSRHALRRHGPLIGAVVQTVAEPGHRPELEQGLRGWRRTAGTGWSPPSAESWTASGIPTRSASHWTVRTRSSSVPSSTASRTRGPSPTCWSRIEVDPGPGTDVQSILARHARLILAVLAAASEPLLRDQLAGPLKGMADQGWGNLTSAIDRILSGERDPDTLCAGLDDEDRLIVQAILAGLEDPDAIAGLLAT